MRWNLAFVVVSVSSFAWADPAVVTYPPGDDKIVVVKKGEPAPYTGQLFDDNTALRWATWLKQYKARLALDAQAAQEMCAVKVDHEQRLAAIEAERGAKVEADLRERLKQTDAARLQAEEALRDPPFFKQPGVWFGIGLATAVATAGVTAIVIHEAR